MPPGSWATALQARHLAGVWPFLAKAGPGVPVRPGKCDLVGTLEHFPAPWIPVWAEKCDQIGCRPGPKTGRPAAPTAPIQGETVHLGKKIAIALLLLPLAELVGFGLVAWTSGLLEALALMVLPSVAGALVLRHAGRGQMAGLRTALRRNDGLGQVTGSAGFMVALGGILLLLPGFITDLAGACLLLGPVRRWLGAALGRPIERRRPPTRTRPRLRHRGDERCATPES